MTSMLSDIAVVESIRQAYAYLLFQEELDNAYVNPEFQPGSELKAAAVAFAQNISGTIVNALERGDFNAEYDDFSIWEELGGKDRFEHFGWWHRIALVICNCAKSNGGNGADDVQHNIIMNALRENMEAQ